MDVAGQVDLVGGVFVLIGANLAGATGPRVSLAGQGGMTQDVPLNIGEARFVVRQFPRLQARGAICTLDLRAAAGFPGVIKPTDLPGRGAIRTRLSESCTSRLRAMA